MGKIVEIIKERKFKYIAFFWFFISLQFVMGSNLQTKGYTAKSTQEFWIDVLKIVILWILFIILHYIVLNLIEMIKQYKNQTNNKEKTQEKSKELIKNKSLLYFLFIFLCWLPVLLAFYPCNISYDGGYQVLRYYFLDNLEHHPILITKLFTAFYVIGLNLNSPTVGMLLFSLFQMTFMALAFSCCVKFIEDQTNNKVIKYISLIFYALYPYHQLMSITTTKDVIFSGLFLIYVIYLYKILSEKFNWTNYIFAIFIGILMLLSRNNSIYTLEVSLPIIVLALIKQRKKMLKVLILFLIVIVGYKGINNYIYTKESETSDETGFRTTYFAQIVGKVSRDCAEELTDEEKEKIKYYYRDYEIVGRLYEDNIADKAIKMSSSNISTDREGYLKFVFELCKKYPRTALEAILNLTRGYWYINDTSFTQIMTYKHPGAIEIYEFEIGKGDYAVKSDSKLPGLRKLYINLYRSSEYLNIPILYIFLQPAFFFYCTFAFLLYSIYKKEKNRLVIAIFLFTFYASCYMANCVIIRYIYPVVVSLPLMLLFVTKDEKVEIEKEENESK